MHIYFDGTTIYAAKEVGSGFLRYPGSYIYNSDGTITFSGQILTPVKNGENIGWSTCYESDEGSKRFSRRH